MRTPLLLLLLLALILGIVATACQEPQGQSPVVKPHSVILLIGDGMGLGQITFARNMTLDRGERFAFESLPVTGLVSTYAASNFTTDSSAAGTAMATGVKTHNQVLGLDAEYRPLATLADRAKAKSWKIGYITDTAITHATPAAFYASACNRYEEVDSIALQLLEQGPDLAFGGGSQDFLPVHKSGNRQDSEDLLERAKTQGYSILRQASDLEPDITGKVLGLFADNHLPFLLDDLRLPESQRAPSLVQMTEKALETLGRDGDSFFLLIEGGRIDQAAHAFDSATLLLQIQAFDQAVQAVLDFQKVNPDTLVLITADHATGGLAINDFADWNSFSRQKASIEWIVAQIRNEEEPADLARVHELVGHDHITEEDRRVIETMSSSYDAGRYLGSRLAEKQGITWVPKVDSENTAGHTGEDVALFAQGPGAQRFGGSLENTDIPDRLLELLGWEALNPSRESLEPMCKEVGGRLMR